jgi:hypothetical protein
MSRRKKNPLRPLTPEERSGLETISRSSTQPASRVARAKSLLALQMEKLTSVRLIMRVVVAEKLYLSWSASLIRAGCQH